MNDKHQGFMRKIYDSIKGVFELLIDLVETVFT